MISWSSYMRRYMKKYRKTRRFRTWRKKYMKKYWQKASFKAQRNKYQKRYRLQSMYGLSWDDYFKKLDNQKGQCAICGTSGIDCKKRLNVDHCHKTGKIRGLLCFNCNGGLGQFKDKTESLRKAIVYLKRWK